jgi:hypothetical protein
VKERKPKTSQEAGELADDHIRARKSGDGKPPKDIPLIRCSLCKKLGHSETCRVNLKSEDGFLTSLSTTSVEMHLLNVHT